MITKRNTIPSLTGIRGIAALWVMTYHVTLGTAGQLLHSPSIGTFSLFAKGWAGVDLFFVLSGFILMHSHGGEFANLSKEAVSRFAKLRVADLPAELGRPWINLCSGFSRCEVLDRSTELVCGRSSG